MTLEKPGHLYLKSDCWGKLHDQGSNDCAWGNSGGEQLRAVLTAGGGGRWKEGWGQTKKQGGGEGEREERFYNEIASPYSFSTAFLSLIFFFCIIQERSFSSFFSEGILL